MGNKTQVALFDFCGTFIPFQSGDEFIRFATSTIVNEQDLLKERKRITRVNKNLFLRAYQKFFNKPLGKGIIASRIKGMSKNELKLRATRFIEEKIKPALLKETLELLKYCQENNYYCLMVSAAYDLYLESFCEEYGFDGVVCSQLECKNEVMTGKIINDCFGRKKKKYALRFLNKKFGKKGYEIVFSVADSITDLAVQNLAKRKIVISKNKHQKWVNKKFEEIVYVN